jgi:hypothetical protein
VRGQGIFDGKIVQTELMLNQAEDVLVRLEQPDPDEPVVAAEGFADVRERQIGDAPSVGVGRTVDDAGLSRVFVFVEHEPRALSHRPDDL